MKFIKFRNVIINVESIREIVNTKYTIGREEGNYILSITYEKGDRREFRFDTAEEGEILFSALANVLETLEI